MSTCLQCMQALSTFIPNTKSVRMTDQMIFPSQETKDRTNLMLENSDTVAKVIPYSYCLVIRTTVQLIFPNAQTPHNICVSFECPDAHSCFTPFFHCAII